MGDNKEMEPNERYYPVEEGYDKKVYENTFFSWIQILLVLCGFYAYNWIMTWGLFELGMWRSTDYTTLAVVIFLVTFLGLIIMIISGSQVNKKKHFEEFLQTKISELKARKEEEDNKAKQKAEYEQRLRDRKRQEENQI